MEFIYETKRLYLRILDPSWSNAVLRFYLRNRDSFEPVEPPRVPNFYTESFHETNLTYEYNEFIRRTYLRLFLFTKENPSSIAGSICFNNIRYSCFKSCMVGYKTDFSCAGQGYMSEALEFAIHEIMFQEYRMHRIEAVVQPDNLPSLKVLERLGFTCEGIIRDYAELGGIWRNHLRYSILSYQYPKSP